MRTALAAFALIGLCCTGCSTRASDAEIVGDLTGRVIAPAYESAATAFAALDDAVARLCAAPSDAALATARQAWRGASESWKRTEAAAFGPVMDRRSKSFVDWRPVDRERTERAIARTEAISARDVRQTLASTQRGLGAIEYLIFADGALDALAADASRCAYAAALATVAATEAQGVFDDWDRSYATIFVDIEPREAVAMVVRTQVFLLRSIVGLQLGPALGPEGTEQDPSAAPSGPARHWAADLRMQVEGMRNVYVGAGERLGLGALVADLSGETDRRMRAAYAAVLTAIGALPRPLSEAAHARSAEARAIYDALIELQRTLNTEVVSLLGVSVGFSDTDGDSLR